MLSPASLSLYARGSNPPTTPSTLPALSFAASTSPNARSQSTPRAQISRPPPASKTRPNQTQAIEQLLGHLDGFADETGREGLTVLAEATGATIDVNAGNYIY